MASVFAGGNQSPLIKLALGKGKKAKALFAVEPLADIVAELKKLPRDISTKYQLRALRKAAKPGQEALRKNVAALGQVTGNLLASVSKKEKEYDNNKANLPVGVIIVGFRRPVNSKSQRGAAPAFEGGGVLKGPNRGYHSHMVEYGTKSKTPGIKTARVKRKRVIFGGRIRTSAESVKRISGASRRIMSSGFSKDGGADQRKGKRRYFTGRGQYPVDFIATGTVRGTPARRPLTRAFQSTQSQMQSILDVEMRKALTAAIRATQKKYGDFGL
jgi:hypothetical protein